MLPDRVSGMASIDILRKQKGVMLMRVQEQNRKIESLQREVSALKNERSKDGAKVSAINQSWEMLNSNLEAFCTKLESDFGSSKKEEVSLLKYVVSLNGDHLFVSDINDEDVVELLKQKSQRSRGLLERISGVLAKNGHFDKGMDELQARFAELSTRFSALNERNEVLNAENEKLRAHVDELEMQAEKQLRQVDKLKSRIEEGEANVASNVIAVKSESSGELKKEAMEPETKKTKTTETAGSENRGMSEDMEELNTKIEALEKGMSLLKEENERLGRERDDALVNYKQLTDDAIRSSALFISQQASLAWHVKEQSSHSATVTQLTDELNAATEAHKVERERMAKWRKEWEESTRVTMEEMKKELGDVRMERDELKMKLQMDQKST